MMGKVQNNTMTKKTKEFLARKYAEQWIGENKEMFSDYQELCHDLLMFRFNWGIEIGFIFKNDEERGGRKLGEDRE